MERPVVAICDSVFPDLTPTYSVLSQVGAEVRLAKEPSTEAIMRVTCDADAVLVTYAKLTEDIIRQMTRCRIIARFGIGVDNVDISAATGAGIVVTKVPDYCIDEVSDHTLALLLALVRKIPFANACAQAGGWGIPAVAPIHRLRGSVLGLVGFGRIPQLVAPKAKAFGIRTVSHDPFVTADVFTQAAVESMSFCNLLAVSDYVSIHTPLTPETRHLFNADAFSEMKSSAYLINTARGDIIDESALVRSLDVGHLAGAALDVLSQEPPATSPLLGRHNVIFTPHMSFYSVESLVDLQTKASEEIIRVLSGHPARNPVTFGPPLSD